MNNLYGHNEAWKILTNDYLNNHLAHAYLLAGPKGIGKFSTSKEYIKYLLGANEVLSKRIENNSFLDLLYIAKQDKNEITIDCIRKAVNFFNQTPSEGKYKFVIIDGADDLNRNAANALLKILEEPTKNTHIFLISHLPYKLLPTIRSRCRIIKFNPLDNQALNKITNHDSSELEDFIAGSPGRAILADELDSLNLYYKLIELIENNDITAFNKFTSSIAKDNKLWDLISNLLLYLVSDCIKISSNNFIQKDSKQDALIKIAQNKTTERWFIFYDQLKESLLQTEIYNLDRKQLLLINLYSIKN